MKLRVAVVGLMLAWGVASAATDTPKTYTPSEVQSLRLQVRQKDLQIAQKDYQAAFERAQGAYKGLLDEAERVKAENKWGADVKFDAGSLGFSEAPKPAEPAKEAPKKP